MLNELLKDYNPKHSRYQISNYIIALNGRTKYGQYKQVLREIFPRVNNITQALAEIAILEQEIAILQEANYENFGDKYKIEKIKQQRKHVRLKQQKDHLQIQLKEFKEFYSIALQLKNELGELTEQRKEELEKEYWVITFKEKIALELACNGIVSQNTLETILAMPERNEILLHIKQLTNNGENKSFSYLEKLTTGGYQPSNLISDEEAINLVKNNEVKLLER
jgi:hypothetical protein